jgi:RNA polymerase sigma factor (TIGR02999 family)
VSRREGDSHSVTVLLERWRQGDEEALEKLIPLIYDQLLDIARVRMRGERRDHTLQPTALVHEAYARLIQLDLDWQDRAHFLFMAARVMRRVLVDHARARHAAKREGSRVKVSLHTEHAVTEPEVDMLALDEALERLRSHEERPARIVELHYFGGLTIREIAEVLEISGSTVDRDLEFARAWLAEQLQEFRS